MIVFYIFSFIIKTNNMAFLNKILLTFTEEKEEVYHYEDRIETESGKIFNSLKELIDNYKKVYNKKKHNKSRKKTHNKNISKEYEEKEKQKKLNKDALILCKNWKEKQKRLMKKQTSTEYKERKKQKILIEEENKKKRYKERIENGKEEETIKTIMTHVPKIGREEIIDMLIKEDGDIVNTIVLLGGW